MTINAKKFAGVMQTILAENYDTTVSKKDCETFTNAVLDSIMECLSKGDNVKFMGFGSFEVRSRKERTCMNPQTGEVYTLPTSKSPAFRAGRNLKIAVKGES